MWTGYFACIKKSHLRMLKISLAIISSSDNTALISPFEEMGLSIVCFTFFGGFLEVPAS